MTKKITIFTVFTVFAVIISLVALPQLRIIADSLNKETAYEFSVDGEKWFIASDKENLDSLLQEYKEEYLQNIDKNALVKRIELKQKTEIIPVEVKPEEIASWEEVKAKIYAMENESTVIEVQKGDNLWNIAKANNLSIEELEGLNPEINPEKIFPGDKLVVKPFKPVLDVIIELENTVVQSIPFKVTQEKDSSMYRNQKKTIKEGTEGEKEVTYSIILTNGYQSSLDIIDEKILKEPVNAVVKIGTKTTVSRGGSVNYGVVQGKRISSSFGSRIHPITGKRSYHDGVDIAAAHGNGVYAYSNGRVVSAGYNGGYGYNIVVDHGNGIKTRYAHLSKISVKAGQKVETGQRIGSVGSTGTSTGSHLHFEVIKNGKTVNPLNYI